MADVPDPAGPSPAAGPGDVGPGLSVRMLGALRIWRDGVELDPGPRQQAYLLALLLARAGRPVSTSELIDQIWGDDLPISAVNIVQKYVGMLRRVLEPGLPPRGSGSYLHRHGSGYRFDPARLTLDLVEFRSLLGRARQAHRDGRSEDAVAGYQQALALWHGPAGDGFAADTRSTP